jgi:hypothetical protein
MFHEYCIGSFKKAGNLLFPLFVMLYGVMMTRVCFVLCAAAPHNCIGGSEMNCLPGAAEAATMFADPSKMQNMDGVAAPSHWYKGPVQFM